MKYSLPGKRGELPRHHGGRQPRNCRRNLHRDPSRPLSHSALDIPPTGRRLNVDFVGALRTADRKFASFRVYFNVLDLMTQLGLMG